MKAEGRWAVVAMAIAAALIMTGCADGDSDGFNNAAVDVAAQASPEEAESGQIVDEDLSRAAPARVSISVSGEVSVDWEDESKVRLVTIAPEEERAAHLFSVGFEEMHVAKEPNHHFRWAFDVTGGYDGAGTYEIPAVDQLGEELGIHSQIFFVYAILKDVEHDPPYVQENLDFVSEFNQPLQPCTVEVTEDEATGTVTCPELADTEGRTITLDVSWELLGA